MGVRKIAPGKKPPGILLLRKMPPENCPLGKSLIDFNVEYRGNFIENPAIFMQFLKRLLILSKCCWRTPSYSFHASIKPSPP